MLTSLKGKHAAAPSKLREDEVEESDWVNVSSLLQLDRMGLDEEVSRVGMGRIDCWKMDELKERKGCGSFEWES